MTTPRRAASPNETPVSAMETNSSTFGFDEPAGAVSGFKTIPVSPNYRLIRRSRSALAITDTELKLIAAAAIMGDKSRPNHG